MTPRDDTAQSQGAGAGYAEWEEETSDEPIRRSQGPRNSSRASREASLSRVRSWSIMQTVQSLVQEVRQPSQRQADLRARRRLAFV